MDTLDRAIINRLQNGFPITEQPFEAVAGELDIAEAVLIARLDALLKKGVLSRFGPMYHAERLGGALSLAAMRVSEADFERVAEQVNAFPQVAHNYARDHAFNLWFVLATETAGEISAVIGQIEATTGYPVYDLPKEEEFFVGLKFTV